MYYLLSYKILKWTHLKQNEKKIGVGKGINQSKENVHTQAVHVLRKEKRD